MGIYVIEFHKNVCMGARFDDNVENVLQQVRADGNRHQLERFENLDELEEEDDEEHVEIRGFLVNIIFPHATTTCLWSLHLVFLATYAIVMQVRRSFPQNSPHVSIPIQLRPATRSKF